MAPLQNDPANPQRKQTVRELGLPLHHRVDPDSYCRLGSAVGVVSEHKQRGGVKILMNGKRCLRFEPTAPRSYETEIVAFRHLGAQIFAAGVGPRSLNKN